MAEEVIGDDQRSKSDIHRPLALLNDLLYDADSGPLGEALRPMYVDYLLEHGRSATTPTRRPPTAPERELVSYRDEFPVLERKTYLISASLGPISGRARAPLDGYLDAWAAKGAPDHVWFEEIFPRMGGLKRSFATLAGCDADEVAITTNISVALATIASAIDLRGDRRRVVLSELDFPTDGHVWLAWAAKTGAEIVWLRSSDGLTIPLEAYDEAIDERTARRDGEPRALPVERGRRREGGLCDRRGSGGPGRSSTTTTDSASCRWTCTTSAATSTRRAR